jgi:hypothetical protein
VKKWTHSSEPRQPVKEPQKMLRHQAVDITKKDQTVVLVEF